MVATIVFMIIGFLGTLASSVVAILTPMKALGIALAIGFGIVMISMMILLPIGRIRAKWYTRKMRYMYDYLSKPQNRTTKEVIAFNKETCRLKAKATTPCWTFYNKYWLNRFQTIDLLTVAEDEDDE